MLWERALAGISRAKPWPVDETAITLKLPAVPRRERGRTRWSIAAAATLVAVMAAPLFDPHEPEPSERSTAPSIDIADVAIPPRAPEPILASARIPVFDSTDEIVILEDDDDDEIVIFDEPVARTPATSPRAMRRANARATARIHLKAGVAARREGDLAAAKRELEAALVALPSYAPAAAALAEIHMKRGNHRAALAFAKRAARVAPRNLDYMLLLADAYARTNDRAAAEKLRRKARRYGARVPAPPQR
jgi:tetratricopeptide (TPR) repeat protein